MKHFVKASVTTAVILGASLAASSAFAAPAVSIAGSIANTRHNMGSTGGGPNSAAPGDTAEICIFCHTPHGGETVDAAGNQVAVPLWNKILSTATFSTYDQLGTSTLDAAVGTVGSVSLACLTCHDGTQAIDNIVNAPGSGGYNSTGGGTGGLGWTWATDGTLDTTGRFTGSVDTGGNNIWQIGTDLTNDHPVSMQYGGGGYSALNPDGNHFGTLTPTRDQDFAPAIQIGTGARWYVDNVAMANEAPTESIENSFDKWDFKLYTRDTSLESYVPTNGAAFANQNEPFVECGSCHDPHFQTTTFLRMSGVTDLVTNITTVGGTTTPGINQSNVGSRVCLTCHTK
ncbi:MAG: hypothetical protein COB30_005685 [Ectothiorhodospiraceae bacterium]|nr:hypothetical protein [Ectothiorhodospiraceae bacterium]